MRAIFEIVDRTDERMLQTECKILFTDSKDLSFLPSKSIALVVTSPPYPMIEMWDELFVSQSEELRAALEEADGREAFRLMHERLDPVWKEVYRVLIDGGIACINIGDATRTIGDRFQLYPNHARIMRRCFEIGFDALPVILWRKQTNAPNKFMGAGMLPAGAYVTLEHEYILILRKGGKREFKTPADKLDRRRSAFFWEERNTWFSDVWDFKGARQDLNRRDVRERSAAFPLELAYRLVNMYSIKGDTVLDPFLGTGTTLYAAMAAGRNGIGVEIDPGIRNWIAAEAAKVIASLNGIVEERLNNHLRFVEKYLKDTGPLKHTNRHYRFPVMTSQEEEIILNYIDAVDRGDGASYRIRYHEEPLLRKPCVRGLDPYFGEDQKLQWSLFR